MCFEQSPARDELEILKFMIAFMLTVGMRAQHRAPIPTYIQYVRKALKQNYKLSLWFLETFTNHDIIREFLVDCSVHDMSRFVSGLLNSAMQTVYKEEEASIVEYIK